MMQKTGKTSARSDFFNARIDAIRISSHERDKAKARFAQAEAMVDVLAGIAGSIDRLLKITLIRPYRRLIANHG